MKKTFYLGVIVCTSVFLSACEGDEKIQSVQWYKEHDKERRQTLAKCRDSSAETMKKSEITNCTNADKAYEQSSDNPFKKTGGLNIKASDVDGLLKK